VEEVEMNRKLLMMLLLKLLRIEKLMKLKLPLILS